MRQRWKKGHLLPGPRSVLWQRRNCWGSWIPGCYRQSLSFTLWTILMCVDFESIYWDLKLIFSSSVTVSLRHVFRAFKMIWGWMVRSGYLIPAFAWILADVQYATLIAVLYATYCPAQIPSNMASVSEVPWSHPEIDWLTQLLNYVTRYIFRYKNASVLIWIY